MSVGPSTRGPPDPGTGTWRFGPFLLDAQERRLLRDGQAIELRPKAFDALVLLLAHAGRLVSKDDFFVALWPRTIVGDASLNKCVWQLRQALSDDDGRYIETVPKVGYRFVAPVERVEPAIATGDAPSPSPPTAPVEPAATPPRRRWPWLLVVAATVVALLMLQLPPRGPEPRIAPPAGGTRVLAIAGMEDLNPGPQTAWVGTALLELSAAEFAGIDDLRATPAETLRDFGFDPVSSVRASPLNLPAALRADWRLSGTYVTIAAAGMPREIQVALSVSDAATGTELAQASRRGLETDLFGLVSAAGAELRQELGLADSREAAYADERSVLPADPAARQAYADGLAALRRFDLLLATRQLQEVVARAPDFAPAHAALAQGWYLLGYERRARESMATAVRLSTTLPRTVRLAYAAQAGEYDGKWDEAIRNYEALATLYPEDPDYALRLATAQIRAGKNDDGLATLDRLVHAVPSSADDPRVWYSRARGNYMQGQNAPALADTEKARSLAERAQAPLLAAEAAIHQGWALQMLKRPGDAEAAYAYSRDTFANAGHAANAARASFQLLQARFLGTGSYASLEPEMQELLRLARAAGSRRVEASVQTILANLYWSTRRYDEGRATLTQLLELERELGNRSGEGRAHIMLAGVHEQTGELEVAASEYELAATLLREIDAPGDLAWALVQHADLERERGRFERALALLEESRTAAGRTDEALQNGDVAYHGAILALDRHQLDQGDALVATAAEHFAGAGHADRVAMTAGVQAELAVARDRLDDAWTVISKVLAESTLEADDADAWPAALGARIQAGRGEKESAHELIGRSTALLPALGTASVGLTTRLYLAESHFLLGEDDAARDLWRHVEQAAGRRGLDLLRLEAALGLACRDPRALAQRVAEAERMGFGRGVAWAGAHCGGPGAGARTL